MTVLSEPVVVFDGECGLCRYGTAHIAARFHLPARRLAWQDADLDALGLSEAQVRDRMWFLSPGIPPAGGAAAFAGWLAGGDGTARALATLLRAKGIRNLAEIVYRVIARNRYRIPGPWERTCTR